jgi:hypothetical protein
MRVLSFIPAFLLAAASFVAAAPASGTPSDVASCPSNSGNDAPLQPVITIIANATTYIQPLSGQLGMHLVLHVLQLNVDQFSV